MVKNKEATQAETAKKAEEALKTRKAKQIFLRVSDNLYESIEKAIRIGIADNAPEFVRRCVVNQLMELNLLDLGEKG